MSGRTRAVSTQPQKTDRGARERKSVVRGRWPGELEQSEQTIRNPNKQANLDEGRLRRAPSFGGRSVRQLQLYIRSNPRCWHPTHSITVASRSHLGRRH